MWTRTFFSNNCSQKELIKNLNLNFLFENRPIAIKHDGEKLIQAINKYCSPGVKLEKATKHVKSSAILKRSKALFKFLPKLEVNRKKCEFRLNDIIASLHFIKDYPEKINQKYQQKLNQSLSQEIILIKDKSRDCLKEFHHQFQCSSNAPKTLNWLITKSSKRSIKDDFQKVFKSIAKDCVEKEFGAAKKVLKEIFSRR